MTHDIEEALFLGDRIVFFSLHPGTVIEDGPIEFKQGKRFLEKEACLDQPGYIDAERHIMSLMRSQRAAADEEQ